jgi:ABC-type uncharacterized transport system fused permease/ATPase subunit
MTARPRISAQANWPLTLSGGQKQRVAMARLFYHQVSKTPSWPRSWANFSLI